MHRALAALLTDSLPHYPYLGQDAYGKPSYGPVVMEQGRLEFRVQKIVDATGQERTSRARIFFQGTVAMDLRDKIVFPDSTAPPILIIYSPKDQYGAIDHHECAF